MTAKTTIIEDLFFRRWNEQSKTLSNPLVTLADVSDAIGRYNDTHPTIAPISTRNPANFFKDFIRNKESANRNWPKAVFDRGYTGRQVTGNNACDSGSCLTDHVMLNEVKHPNASGKDSSLRSE